MDLYFDNRVSSSSIKGDIFSKISKNFSSSVFLFISGFGIPTCKSFWVIGIGTPLDDIVSLFVVNRLRVLEDEKTMIENY